jgi:group I intron endonuclease
MDTSGVAPESLLDRCAPLVERKDDCSGIYMIFCWESRKAYIGSSVSVYHRFHTHTWKLEGSEHHTRHLQHAYNHYGADAFKFLLLERLGPPNEVPQELLVARENYYLMELLDRAKLYNTEFPATIGRPLGTKHTPESCAKMRDTWRRKVAEGYTMPEGMSKSSENHPCAKLSEEDVAQILEMRRGRAKYKEIATKFGVSMVTVGRILGGRSWKHLDREKVLVGSIQDRGEKHRLTKLSDAQLREIEALLREGDLSQEEIGRRFGVSQNSVSRIKLGKARVA